MMARLGGLKLSVDAAAFMRLHGLLHLLVWPHQGQARIVLHGTSCRTEGRHAWATVSGPIISRMPPNPKIWMFSPRKKDIRSVPPGGGVNSPISLPQLSSLV